MKPNDHQGFDKMYEQRWDHAIKKGKLQLGNLQINLACLEQTGLMRKGMNILELGCGSGNLAQALSEQGISMTASDISKTAIEHARGRTR